MNLNTPKETTLPLFTSELDVAERFEQFERKYNDLKISKQKLLEYIKKRELDHQKEITDFRKKLEEKAKYIRKLEDENLALQFEVSSLKKKEASAFERINNVKSIVNRYKDRNSQGSNENDTTRQNDSRQEKRSGLFLEIPQDKAVPKKNPILSAQLYPVQEGYEESPMGYLTASPQALTSTNRYNSLIELKQCNSSDRLNQMSELPQLELKKKGKSGIDFKKRHTRNRGRELSIEKASKISRSTQRYSSPDSEASPVKKTKRRNSVVNQRRRSASSSWIEGKDYLCRFNTLSQSIVSLGVKPEIAVDQFGQSVGNKEDANAMNQSQSFSDHQRKSPLLRYVSKASQEYLELLHNQQTPKVSAFTVEEVQQTKNLFEDFFVIGVDKEDLKEYSKQHPEVIRKKSGKLKARILYRYAIQNSSLPEQTCNSISDFAFPFGVQVYKLRSTPSFSALNPIIYVSSDGDIRAKCFMFPLLSGNLSDEKTKMGEVIDASNSNHLLYVVCIVFKDFITMGDFNKPKKSVNEVKYWEVKKIMCFVTYYPINNFFFDTLIKLLDILKVERMMQISQVDSEDLERHTVVDSGFTSKYFESIVKKNLDELLNVKTLAFSTHLELKMHGNFMETKVLLEIQDLAKAFTMESDWGCLTVFDYFSLKDLLWLFNITMLERKVVFLSKNLFLITATLSVILSLMKPFKYPFPMIFNLPEVLMVLCDAPGAALIGLNKGEEYAKNLLEEYRSCIVVCLDEGKVYMEREGNVDPPSLETFERSLLNTYVKVNPSLNRRLYDAKKIINHPLKPHNVRYTATHEEKINCLGILEAFKEKLHEKIIANIPEKAIWQAEQQLDFGEIGRRVLEKAATGGDKAFLSHFVKTQIFAYFLEGYYKKVLLK